MRRDSSFSIASSTFSRNSSIFFSATPDYCFPTSTRTSICY
jgi:hypothetical protein